MSATDLRRPPARTPPGTPRRLWTLLLALALLGAVTVLSVAVGSGMLPPATVWQAVTASDGSAVHATVVDLRVPRTLLGIAVGAALGVAGALIQALTRNPLADPGVLGVNAGAGFAVALAVAVLGVTRIEQYLWFAFAGAVAATVVVYAIAAQGHRAPSPLRLTLVGVAFGAVLTGVAQTLALTDPRTFDRMRFWGAGTITDRPQGTLSTILPWLLLGLLVAALCAHPLNAIALGEDHARAVGALVAPTRIAVVLAVTLLCGAATAAAGPIAFVGLMVPHAVRWLTGPDQRWIIGVSAVAGSVLLLSSDVIGRLVVVPAELQVGIVTAFVGAPMLIVLARRTRARAL
ncbi:iron chelate uptake ABC transporter family permease subunit [Phytomonospora sp. NPDC050363]|uniref:iron chelate uptake ABC transporter family permease subunit n=1 Tax=Phytomonospora sp. NPDC050363 TaxID=3155642 RepID=UPI0033E982A8